MEETEFLTMSEDEQIMLLLLSGCDLLGLSDFKHLEHKIRHFQKTIAEAKGYQPIFN